MPRPDEESYKAAIEELEARGEQMRKGLKSNVKFTADEEKLGRVCFKRGISFSALSKKLVMLLVGFRRGLMLQIIVQSLQCLRKMRSGLQMF